mmetsp:Transcript_15032/g.14903  ORF Transcript_15032/g.14903 Transcript_15032/m.14903 type:complete len:334 (+) Transcript_15032:252-1253(+)
MAVNAYTKDMFSGSYKIMLGSQFSDVGDLGDYQQCDDVENAEYNILQLNITKLPLDIRLGLCLPSECNWDKMKKAGESITQSLSKLVKGLANQLNIGLLIDNDVGLQVYFFQPTARNKQANDESGTSASAMGGFIGFLVLLSFGGSIAVLMVPTPVPTHPPENFKKQTAQVEQQQEQEYAERGTAAQTLKTKASQYSRPNTIHNRLGQNEVERERENSLFLNNNIVPNLQPIQEDERESVLWSYIKCFSVQDNLEHLISPKRNKLDDPELDIIEGMKVITLCWGIIMYTSLYVLTSSTRNLPILLEFFEQFIFALISSGNKAADFFFMIITMM